MADVSRNRSRLDRAPVFSSRRSFSPRHSRFFDRLDFLMFAIDLTAVPAQAVTLQRFANLASSCVDYAEVVLHDTPSLPLLLLQSLPFRGFILVTSHHLRQDATGGTYI